MAAVATISPIGSYAAANNACPVSGWWQCTDGSHRAEVESGEFRYFRQGERMPQAVLLAPPTLWQRVTGARTRGDGHFSGPELMGLIDSMPTIDFIFGFSCNVKLLAMAEPTRLRAIDLWVSVQTQDVVPNAVHLFDEFVYKARSWPRAWRVPLKDEVMALGANTCC